MERIAKLFRNGRNQAVRLPVEFEFDTDRVYIRRDKEGNVILSKKTCKTRQLGKCDLTYPKSPGT
ncbi:antitoxin [Dryocola clanedunensis]|uniref:antitoxin n=1 Tax=Dryocola clanedunensis TaxID=2925396 RepID=UPI0038CC1700